MAYLKDHDDHYTEITRFQNDGKEDICTFAQKVTRFVNNEVQTDNYPGKSLDEISKIILMDRINPNDRGKLQEKLDRPETRVTDLDFGELRRMMCITFGPANAEQYYLSKLFSDRQLEDPNESFKVYFDRKEDCFNKYLLYLDGGSFTFQQFLTYLINGAQQREKIMIQEAKLAGHIANSAELFGWVENRKDFWDEIRTPDSKTSGGTNKQASLNTNQTQSDNSSSICILTTIATDIAAIRSEQLSSSSSMKQMKQELSDTSSRIDKLENFNKDRNGYNDHRNNLDHMQVLREIAQMNQMHQTQMNMMQGAYICMEQQNRSPPPNDRYQQRGRDRYNNNQGSYDRSRSPSPYYQRGRSRDLDESRHNQRPRTRSPSPFDGCHSCGEVGHYGIECPYKTPEERELKLLYQIEKMKFDRGKEEELREKYNLKDLGINKHSEAKNKEMRFGQFKPNALIVTGAI